MRWRLALIALVLLVASAAPAVAADLVVQKVDTSDFPTVKLTVALPSGLDQGSSEPRFTVRENGATRSTKAAPESTAVREPVDVVLLLDASGSMKGEPLAAAKRAAEAFVGEMGAEDRIAVIAIGEKPQVLTGFTSDRAALARAITSVEAKGETALYDSLVTAAAQLKDSTATARYAVLLSDGGDTVSAASLDTAVDRLSAAAAPVYAVALSSPEYDPKAIAAVAKSTGGTLLSVKQAAKLGAVFERIAREITGTWVVTFTSAKPDTPDLEIALSAARGERTATSISVAENPAFVSSGTWKPGNLGGLWLAGPWLFAITVGLSVALGAIALALLLRKEGPAIDQLDYYRQLRARTDGVSGQAAAAEPEGVRAKLKGAIDDVAGKRGVSADFKVRLERAGLKLRPGEFIYFHLIAVLGIGLFVELVTRSIPAAMLAVLLTVFVPLFVLDWKAGRRRHRFEEQMPDIISLISGSLRAGWGIQQAIDLIVEETSEPARTEFSRVQSETRLGLSLEESLRKMAERIDSDDYRWVVAAIGIQREVGGNLAEVLDIAAGTIRERAELKREVVALTAEGRFSAIVLVLLPFVMFGSMTVVAPKYLNPMMGSIYGWGMLGLAVVLLMIGSFWLYRITRIEV